MPLHPAAIVIAIAVVGFLASTPASSTAEDDIRSTFNRFVAAQNAHDLTEVGDLLADSPDFLWITPGHVVRARNAAIDRFRELFKGAWHLEPDWSTFEVLRLDVSTVEVFVHVSTPGGVPDRMKQMNVLLVDTARGWRVRHILVSNLPPAGAACDTPGRSCA